MQLWSAAVKQQDGGKSANTEAVMAPTKALQQSLYDEMLGRISAVARDGTKVPVSIVSKNGVKLDGSAPLLLYAYGSYGASMAPTFSSGRLSLLNRD